MGDSNGLDLALSDDWRRQKIEDALHRLRLSQERYERLVEQTISTNERAAALDGTFDVGSAPGQGTTIYIRVPLPTASS